MARARRGVPIGAGLFGRVASQPPRNAPAGDLDFDGIPDPLDIDDDGDLVLDHFETSGGTAVAGRARVAQQGSPLGLHAFIPAPNPLEIVNANPRDSGDPGRRAFSDAEIDANLAEKGDLVIAVLAGGSAELDCRGLSYCSYPGTGQAGHADAPPPMQLAPFPGPPGNAFFDPDADGFGSLTPFGSGPPLVHLAHRATTAEIKTGDLLIERVATDGEPQEFPGTVPEVLATQSTLASFDDGAGNATTVGYPDVRPGDGPPGFPVADGSDGILSLTVNVWRPQRPPGPGEPGFGQPSAWIDTGGLHYSVSIGEQPGAPPLACPPASLSTTDAELTPLSTDLGGGFTDLAPDRPADPDNTLTYSVNISQCIAELNAASSGVVSWPDGESRLLSFGARDSANRIATGAYFWFKRN